MPRVGSNPMKKLGRAFQPSEVTVCTLVYIPELTTYWAGAFEVLKASLASIRVNSGSDFDLAVLDNGSCPEVCRYLEQLTDEGKIDILIRCAHNHGKLGAWNVLFPACPGRYIAYTDSDVLFGPGWLDETLQVFRAFENVGVVTGRPTRTEKALRDLHLGATLKYADTAPQLTVERGNLIPREVLDEHEHSLGPHGSKVFHDPNYVDVRISRGDVAAYASAGHFQFVVPRDVALKLLPIESVRAMGGINENWDSKMNALGLLRLSLTQPQVWHVGNMLDEGDFAIMKRIGVTDDPDVEPQQVEAKRLGIVTRTLRMCARSRRPRRMIEKAYLSLFEALK